MRQKYQWNWYHKSNHAVESCQDDPYPPWIDSLWFEESDNFQLPIHHLQNQSITQFHLLSMTRSSWTRSQSCNKDLWSRERCDRIQSKGIPDNCRSACKRCCRRRLYATGLGVVQGELRLLPSTISWSCGQRILVVSPSHCHCVRHRHDHAQ